MNLLRFHLFSQSVGLHSGLAKRAFQSVQHTSFGNAGLHPGQRNLPDNSRGRLKKNPGSVYNSKLARDRDRPLAFPGKGWRGFCLGLFRRTIHSNFGPPL